MKINYETPKIEVLNLETESAILAASTPAIGDGGDATDSNFTITAGIGGIG